MKSLTFFPALLCSVFSLSVIAQEPPTRCWQDPAEAKNPKVVDGQFVATIIDMTRISAAKLAEICGEARLLSGAIEVTYEFYPAKSIENASSVARVEIRFKAEISPETRDERQAIINDVLSRFLQKYRAAGLRMSCVRIPSPSKIPPVPLPGLSGSN